MLGGVALALDTPEEVFASANVMLKRVQALMPLCSWFCLCSPCCPGAGRMSDPGDAHRPAFRRQSGVILWRLAVPNSR